MISTFEIQTLLLKHGYNPGEIDGIMGPKTRAAIVSFKKSRGLRARPYVGPITIEALRKNSDIHVEELPTPPWVGEMDKHRGLHEVNDWNALTLWLGRDGRALGDIRRLPWCGDAVETAIRLTLPEEEFPGALGENPYWARNWAHLGNGSKLRYGCLVVLTRGKGGHVCFAVGYDPKRKRIRVLGGNQSNRVSFTWVDERRLLGYKKGMDILGEECFGLRSPSSWKHPLPSIPIMNSKGQVISRNEF